MEMTKRRGGGDAEMTERPKLDGRREAGERTRERLIHATRSLLAEHGEDAVTLRDITQAAGANVAAVSYHFGSKEALCRATCEQAVSQLIDEQIRALGELGDDASLEEIAAAWTGPVIKGVSGTPGETQCFMRIVARLAADPPAELRDWLASAVARADAELLRHLRRALPGVSDDELRIRTECAAGIFHFIATGNMRCDLAGKSEEEVERLIVPVIAGALAGGAASARPVAS
jgi:AcrR family transcriptional regulator